MHMQRWHRPGIGPAREHLAPPQPGLDGAQAVRIVAPPGDGDAVVDPLVVEHRTLGQRRLAEAVEVPCPVDHAAQAHGVAAQAQLEVAAGRFEAALQRCRLDMRRIAVVPAGGKLHADVPVEPRGEVQRCVLEPQPVALIARCAAGDEHTGPGGRRPARVGVRQHHGRCAADLPAR
ncbi:MAG: hypothetical protein IPP50_00405 [Piscinibacter sp.]|nr:hypothetical protein [Piscinibacter sp.]